MNRSTRKTVTFTRPFLLPELDGLQPASPYVVDTEEELLQALSFEAWRRLSTTIRLPRRAGGPPVDQVAEIDPIALAAALARDLDPA